MKYKQWLYEWLENYVKISSKARTVERYEQIIERHLAPKLGEYDLNELTPMILQKYMYRYYSANQEAQYGVLGIEIEVIPFD